jgi:hypothetical protein
MLLGRRPDREANVHSFGAYLEMTDDHFDVLFSPGEVNQYIRAGALLPVDIAAYVADSARFLGLLTPLASLPHNYQGIAWHGVKYAELLKKKELRLRYDVAAASAPASAAPGPAPPALTPGELTFIKKVAEEMGKSV